MTSCLPRWACRQVQFYEWLIPAADGAVVVASGADAFVAAIAVAEESVAVAALSALLRFRPAGFVHFASIR